MTTTEFSGTESTDVRIDQLASSRAALSSDRRELRADIALSTTLAVLAGRGSLNELEILEAVSRVWRTGSLTGPVLRRSLADAEAAGLVVRQHGLDEVERFALTEVAKRELDEERNWADRALRAFETDVAFRLAEYDDERLQGKERRVALLVLEALASSVDGEYTLDVPAANPSIRPISVRPGVITEFSGKLEPAGIRQPVRDIALDALDPTDDFGNEIVHLVVAGSLLHGVITQRGLAVRPDLTGMRVLLDTSTLVVLGLEPGDLDRRLLEEAVGYSNRLGVEVYVAEHSIEEWNRLWDAADEEAGRAQLDHRDAIPILSYRMEGNPFVSAYLAFRESGESQTFAHWARERRNLRLLVENLGATVRPHGNNRQEDLDLHARVQTRLMQLDADPRVRAHRTRAAADADAHSCSMVVRWREALGPGRAFFIALETLTDRVHREMFPESDPLVVNPQAWLLFVANLATDDPREAAGVADLVADSVVRSTFLSLAGAHTLEDALQMAGILTRDGQKITSRDLRDLQDESLFEHLDRSQAEENRSPAERASLVLQRRSRRAALRARRVEERVTERIHAVEGEAEQRVKAELVRASAALARAETSERRYVLLRRRVIAATISVGILAVAVWLLTIGQLSGRWFLGATVGMLAASAYGWEWLTTAEVTAGRFVRGFSADVLLLLAGALFS